MDFEEGEVDDVSDSELERSPAVTTERTNGKGIECVNTTRSQPCSRHKREQSQRPKSRHSKRSRPTQTNGHADPLCFPQLDTPIHSWRNQESTSLKDHLSDGDDVVVSTRGEEKKGKPHGFDNKRRKKKRVERVSKPVLQTQCRYFMGGRCVKGDNCPFAHDFQPPKKKELCKFYAVGVCSKGPACLFLHSEFPCKFFHLSGKCNHGSSCKFSHAPLTGDSKLLLHRIAGVRDPQSSSHDRGSDVHRLVRGGLHPGFVERNDVDYRFGHRPPHYSDTDLNYESHSPPHLTSGRNFHSNPSGSVHERRDLLGPRPPLSFHHDNRMEAPRFGLETRSRMPANSSYVGLNCGPFLLSSGAADVSLHTSSPLHFSPDHPLHMTPFDGLNPTDLPRLRPPGLRIALPLRPPFNSSIYPTSEAIVSSELDKMAALLASSKPPVDTEASTSPSYPRIQSPSGFHKWDSAVPDQEELKSPTLLSSFHVPPICSPGSQPKKPSLDLASPDPNAIPLHPSLPVSPASVQWRLVQLDMNVKIPYPLMQLSIEDLPHRFDDPRLKGQLAALRPHLKPAIVPKDGDVGCETESLEPEAAVLDTNQTDDIAKPVAATSRRPVKLQLNEMASTFAAIQPTVNESTLTRTADRSYLDDPRFRRRRIVAVASVSPEVLQKDVTKVAD